MAKKIVFDYKGKTYTMEYSRSSVRQMESMGFDISTADTKPETFLETLFNGAFLMHHKNVATNTAMMDEIYNNFTNREELITTLAEMYQETLLSSFEEPEENEGNIKWGVR